MNQVPSQGHQVDLSRYNIRTDLARESHELATKRNRSGERFHSGSADRGKDGGRNHNQLDLD